MSGVKAAPWKASVVGGASLSFNLLDPLAIYGPHEHFTQPRPVPNNVTLAERSTSAFAVYGLNVHPHTHPDSSCRCACS